MEKNDFIIATQLYGLHEYAESLVRAGKGLQQELNGKKGMGTWELLLDSYYNNNEVYVKFNGMRRDKVKSAYDYLVYYKMLEPHPVRIFYYKFLPINKNGLIKLIYES